MRIICRVQVLSIPARLEVDLGSETIYAVGLIDEMGIWSIVSLVYAAETYPIGNGPDIVERQRTRIIVSKFWVSRNHSEAWWEGLGVRSISSSSLDRQLPDHIICVTITDRRNRLSCHHLEQIRMCHWDAGSTDLVSSMLIYPLALRK